MRDREAWWTWPAWFFYAWTWFPDAQWRLFSDGEFSHMPTLRHACETVRMSAWEKDPPSH
jgi:hypothetical protein